MNSADVIDLTDLDNRLTTNDQNGERSNAAESQSVTNKNAEVIDLVSPARAHDLNSMDAVNGLLSNKILTSQQKDKSARRSRKRKKALTDAGDLSSALQTREHSVDNGDYSSEQSNQRVSKTSNRKARREDQRETHRFWEDKRRSHTPSPPLTNTLPSNDLEGLFFIDLQPSQLQSSSSIFSSSARLREKTDESLLLPAHVSIFGSEPVEILAPAVAEFDEDYIDYLDIDDSKKNMVRYFEASDIDTTKPARIVCKQCGAEGEHSTASCPVLICLTCGARNEHSTRSCPISKTCYTCGMKGHINATCPNRRAARRGEMDNYDDCDRCGSELHKANECPTLWRLYDYLTEANRNSILHMRWQKQQLGEGNITGEEWCYNCAGYGHWGDDCQDLSHRDDIPNEYSAFSEHNTLSGPFFDTFVDRASSKSRRRQNADRDLPRELLESWGKVPENVGKKGRMDRTARMRRRAHEQTAEDDPDDWFGNQKNVRNRSMPQHVGTNASKKLAFGRATQESRQRSPPSLLQRIGDRYDHDEPQRQSRDAQSIRANGDDNKQRSRYREPDKRRRNPPGPRYKGGYLR